MRHVFSTNKSMYLFTAGVESLSLGNGEHWWMGMMPESHYKQHSERECATPMGLVGVGRWVATQRAIRPIHTVIVPWRYTVTGSIHTHISASVQKSRDDPASSDLYGNLPWAVVEATSSSFSRTNRVTQTRRDKTSRPMRVGASISN